MSAGGDHSDVRDGVPEGDDPPPGFEESQTGGQDHPTVLQSLRSEPRANRSSDLYGSSAASGPHQERGRWQRSDQEQDRGVLRLSGMALLGASGTAATTSRGEAVAMGDDKPGWGRRTSWDVTSAAPGWHPRDADSWAHGPDPWSRSWKDANNRARHDGWALPTELL